MRTKIDGFAVDVVVVCTAAGAVLCELCDRLFHERMDYKHHFKRCHLGQFNIRCDACCKGFWKTNALRQHTCYPEMRDENVRLQREREEEALRQRSKVRASMGLDEGAGIDVVDVVETQKVDDAAEKLECDAKAVKVSSSACDSTVTPSRSHSSHQTSCASSSQNISETTADLLTVSENSQSNTCSDTLPSHSYGTRRRRISFLQLLHCS